MTTLSTPVPGVSSPAAPTQRGFGSSTWRAGFRGWARAASSPSARRASTRASASRTSTTAATPAPPLFVPPAEGVWCDPRRVRALRGGPDPVGDGPIVYWMSRDQRVHDNWALTHALAVAQRTARPLAVVFNLVPEFAHAGARQYCFMLRGLRELAAALDEIGVPFHLVAGDAPGASVSAAAERLGASLLVTDFSPLRVGRRWRDDVTTLLCPCDVPVHEVDAHNVVPAWEASDKQEYAARTIRKKINGRLDEFLTEFPTREAFAAAAAEAANAPGAEAMPPPPPVDWDAHLAEASAKGSAVPEVRWQSRAKIPGEKAALAALCDFAETHRLAKLYARRNDPNAVGAQSGLSPYLHFGQLAAQRAALEASKTPHDPANKDDPVVSFLEELLVRRELSDNFCAHNPHYDSLLGASGWARETLDAHAEDEREFAYTREQFERAETHDELWNAAQKEMTALGSMHGFLRMYWAKKILEWTPEGPARALETAIYLNDKYQLDGRDPNGYVGCMWAVAGVHDQGWKERPVFGKVRFMNYAGCKRKFDVGAYVARIEAEVREEKAAQAEARGESNAAT